MDPDESLEEAILTHESWTLDPAVRSSIELMGDLLSDDFVELGASGRVHTRGEVLELSSTTESGEIEIDAFAMRALGSEHAPTTCRAAKPGAKKHGTGVAWRCSPWRLEGERWCMIYH
jgi:hypothetical protein